MVEEMEVAADDIVISIGIRKRIETKTLQSLAIEEFIMNCWGGMQDEFHVGQRPGL